MFYKVKIKKIPTARVGMQVQGALSNDTMPFNGKGTTQMNSVPAPSVKKTLQPVARKDANLEAEKGETVIGNIDGSNMPSLFNIGGKRHVNGGTPLNLPDDSFIFSDTKSMMIKDPQILKMFGKSPRKGGYTPADLSKSYDMNKYRKILQDKNSDAIDKRTAEMMIKNFVIKLGALALAQESQKGFPQGIPALAKPYMETNGITEEDLIPPPPQPAPAPQQQMGQQQMPAPQTMPDGSPIAQPQTMEQDMAQMQQPTPNQMMQWGGVRMLKRAQEGMQQQQAQQQEDPMQQMMQQVSQALQQGTAPEEVAAQLIQNQVPPDQVAQIFVQLGMPEEQVQELVSGVMQQMQGGQEQQMASQQQQPISEEEMMAMQQQDPQQMQQAPMAAYGMEMGGYDMPDYMAYGGYFQEGGRVLTAEELETRRKNATNIRTEKGTACPPGYIKLSDGTCAKGTISEGEAVASSLGAAKAGTGAPNDAWSKTICDQLSKGVTAEALAAQGHGTVAGLKARFADCIKTGEEVIKTGKEEVDFLQLEELPVETPCPCVDDKGAAMKNADGTPMLAKKDASGNCLPCTESIETCECEKEDGTKFDPGKNTDGTCKDCDTPGITTIPTPTSTPAKWWLQDTVNTMGAFGDLARVKKQMPWEARVDLEEPRPVFLDPTRELAAQSEQANIASQASGQFAGAQAQGARLSAIQGQGAESAANTLSRINNANVGIANQFEGQQVGIRNQEQMANQQMANRVYDKNVIANQQFDNAKTAGRSNLRQSYNTGVTNKWKTDALNQMYPNYQTDPSVGGRVAYTPTDKTLDKTAEEQTAQEFADSISGYTPEMQKLLFQQKYGKQFGGQQFEYGGFVYNIFPH
tara:strand:- start:28186 stop:30768 length:2583 start_codon:yes stop_codon:yes gene_type:complete